MIQESPVSTELQFDPYHKWLGIPKDQRPPTHYQLLGIAPDEQDREVIREAALMRTAHLRNFQTGPRAAECQRVLNEVAQATAVLCDPVKRQAYDATLAGSAPPSRLAAETAPPAAAAPAARTKDAATSAAVRISQIEQKQQKVSELRKQHQYPAAVRLLEELAALKDPALAKYAQWARRELPVVKAEPEKIRRERDSACQVARRMVRKHDYEQAADLLQQIPEDLRTPEIQEVLTEALERADEVVFLWSGIETAVAAKQYDGLLPKVDRLLKLKPGHRKARELREDLTRYGKGGRMAVAGKGGRYYDVAGRTVTPKMIALGVAVPLVIFGLMTWAMTIYLRVGEATVKIEIDDPQVTVRLDGGEVAIENLGEPIRVKPGRHLLAVVRDGFEVRTQQFQVKRGDKLALKVTLVDGRLAIAGLPDPPAPEPTAAPEPPSQSDTVADASPPDSSQPAAQPAVIPNYTGDNADRQVIEWARSIGGNVSIKVGNRTIGNPSSLPDEDFVISSVNVGGKDVTDADLRRLRGLRGLESLMVFDTQITDAGLEHLTGLPELRTLFLQRTRVTAAGLAKLKGLPRLSNLDLAGDGVTDECLAALKELNQLSVLSIQNAAVTDAGLMHLKDVGQLRTLTVRQLSNVTPAGVAHIGEVNGLLTLILERMPLNSAGFERLGKLTSLDTLSISDSVVTDADLPHLRRMPRLSRLTLSGSPITDVGLEHLGSLPMLSQLKLEHTAVTDAGLAHLSGCRELRYLWLRNTRVTGAGLAALSDLRKLEHLGLEETDIDDAGAEQLARFPSLTFLNVGATRLTDAGTRPLARLTGLNTLILNGTAVSDASLEHLKPLSGLRTLILVQTQVTDAGLEHLKGHNELRTLALSGSQVTQTGVASLRAALPNCNISFAPGPPGGTTMMTSDRRAADWALAMGGRVRIAAGDRKIDVTARGDLPTGPFVVSQIVLENSQTVSEPGLSQLRGLANLEALNLRGTPLTDTMLGHLASLMSLKDLRLHDTPISDGGLSRLRGLTGLESLVLARTAITDAGLRELAQLTNLTTLDVEGTAVGDDGLAHLTGLERLEKLNLNNTQITDAGIDRLTRLTNLTELRLTGTKVTAAGRTRLQTALPNCKIQ